MANNLLTFRVAPMDDKPNAPGVITPYIDGRSLVDLAGEFEAAAAYKPAGGYSGIVPAYFKFGPLETYYLGTNARQWPKAGTAWLLGCDCGEVGCWPLAARVVATQDQVSWSGFSQPHRPQWDYSAFGPFTFDRAAYDLAVAELAELNTP
jgi:hypothetical protein